MNYISNYVSVYLYNVRMNLNGAVVKWCIITVGQYKHLVNSDNCYFVKQSTVDYVAKLSFINIANDKNFQK